MDENRDSLKDLINSLAELLEVVGDAKVQIPSWKYHTQTLAGKIIFTAHSIHKASIGYDYGFYERKDCIHVIDYSSMFILTRALIENYVTLCYIYNNNLSDEEKIFRYKLWEVSGLISRQGWIENASKAILSKKESEKLLISNILSEIEKIPEYETLDRRALSKLQRHGLPRIYNWHELIEMSNLRREFFLNTYSYLSTYAHSEYISILQLSQIPLHSQNRDNISNVQVSLSSVRMIISMTIDFYVTNYKIAESFYNTLPDEIRNAVLIWQKIGKEEKL